MHISPLSLLSIAGALSSALAFDFTFYGDKACQSSVTPSITLHNPGTESVCTNITESAGNLGVYGISVDYIEPKWRLCRVIASPTICADLRSWTVAETVGKCYPVGDKPIAQYFVVCGAA